MSNDDIRRISIEEREYSLTESQLRQMLEIAGRHHGREGYLGRISSFSAGVGVATAIALLTVPSSSFQGVGAISSQVAYGGCLAVFAISILAAGGIQFAKRLGAFGKAMSTDAVMASLLNPEQSKARRTRQSDGGPQMALRADERGRDISDQKPVPQLELEPKAVVRRRADHLAGTTDDARRDEPIKTNSEIVRGLPEKSTPKLSTSQASIVGELRDRGILSKVALSHRYPAAAADIEFLAAAGLIADSGSAVFLTTAGRLYPL